MLNSIFTNLYSNLQVTSIVQFENQFAYSAILCFYKQLRIKPEVEGYEYSEM